jgi:tetratricopeptide (TPR) repeat protein
MNLHKEEEKIFRILGNADGLQVSLGNQANILSLQGKLDEALKLHKEEEILCRELGAKYNLAMAIENQALIYNLKSDWINAKALFAEIAKLYKHLNNENAINNLSDFLHSKALSYKKSRNLDVALALLEEEEILCTKMQNKRKLAVCLNDQASILKLKNDYREALDLLDIVEEIFKDIGDHEDLAATYGNKANLYYIIGDLDKSLLLYKKLEGISHTLKNELFLAKSLANQALIMKDKLNISESVLLGTKALKLAKKKKIKSLANEIRNRLDL